ncbi:MAG: sigma-54 dependent transcriptional regulator [Bacteroidales bacterium]
MERRNEKVLIVDDDQAILTTVQLFLEEHFEQVHIESNPNYLPEIVTRREYSVVVLDMNFRRGRMDGGEGMLWLKRLQEMAPKTAVVIMTAYGDVELAVEAMKQGAFDFVVKPWKNVRLLTAVMAAANYAREQRKPATPNCRKSALNTLGVPELLGNSLAMQHIRAMLSKVAATEASVVVTGENGTGKGMVARQLHTQSARCQGPFVSVDMGTLTDTLIESELFGYKAGAFTDAKKDKTGRMELANGGTLFLDEIANLSWDKQALLLKAIEERQITPLGAESSVKLDVRLITATHQPLEQLVAAGAFRQDLYYRINTFIIEVPPLRDRLDDLEVLVPFFYEQICRQHNKHCRLKEIPFMAALKQHNWPGNVRELRNVLERTIVLSDENEEIVRPQLAVYQIDYSLRPRNFDLHENEKFLVKNALEACDGNISKAARMLGIDRNALYRRMKKYDIN